MGRQRKRDTHLPRRMQHRHGAFFYLSTVAGKQRWIPLGRDYALALRRWAGLEGEAARPVRTVAEALSSYITTRAPHLARRTLEGYRVQAKRLCAVFGPMRLEDVTRADVYTYLKRRGNIAGNRERDLLRAAYRFAQNTGYAGPNPAEAMHIRNPEAPRKRYITDGELAALITAAKPRAANLLLWLYLTGMRVSDALALQLTAAQDDGIHWTEGKTRKPRHLVWTPALRECWKRAAGLRIGAQIAFLGQRGPYTLDGFESTFDRIRKRAGIADVRANDLRKKAASDLPLDRAQALLGHTTPDITQRHYRSRPDPVRPVK